MYPLEVNVSAQYLLDFRIFYISYFQIEDVYPLKIIK